MVYDNLQAVKALIDCVRGPEMSSMFVEFGMALTLKSQSPL